MRLVFDFAPGRPHSQCQTSMAGRLGLGSASGKHVFLLTKIRLVLQFLSVHTKNCTTLKM